MAVQDIYNAYRCRKCRKVFNLWNDCLVHTNSCTGTKHHIKHITKRPKAEMKLTKFQADLIDDMKKGSSIYLQLRGYYQLVNSKKWPRGKTIRDDTFRIIRPLLERRKVTKRRWTTIHYCHPDFKPKTP